MKKYLIKIFVVKYKGEVMAVDGIIDVYADVGIYSIPKSIIEASGIQFTQGEAKDLIGTYGDIEISIVDKEIEL